MKIHNRAGLLLLMTLVLVVIRASNLSAQNSTGSTPNQKGTLEKNAVGLAGYCPVCIVAAKKWEKGNPDIASSFDGVTYYFPNTSLKEKFDQAPQKFVPVLNGDCIVCYQKHGKRAPGSIRHAAMHDGRLYLFPSKKEKSVFLADAKIYKDSDVAENGNCIVCRVSAGKEVAGNVKHSVQHMGLRYLFPSAKEANVFRQNPNKFVSAKKATSESATGSKNNEVSLVSVTGRSGCAACEFGVSPLGAPKELGLAIVGKDKVITVVEDAHKLYPDIYKSRFNGKQLMAMGTVIKKQDNVVWIKPTSLKAIN